MNTSSARACFTVSMWNRAIAAAVLIAGMALSGCLSANYKMAPKDTPPAVPLNLAFSQAPIAVVLNTLIVYKGPGSWKREALWDEYVLTIANKGQQPVTISAATLVDFASESHAPGEDPWALEKESRRLERHYLDSKMTFVRNVAVGVGVGAGAMAGGGAAGIVAAGGPLVASGAAVAAGAFLVPLMGYQVYWILNDTNKQAVVAEFNRRRMHLPLKLEPGKAVTGSLFFPMVPSPRSLDLHWVGGGGNELAMPLDTLRGLHLKAPAQKTVHQ